MKANGRIREMEMKGGGNEGNEVILENDEGHVVILGIKGNGDKGKWWGREMVTMGNGNEGKWIWREVVVLGSNDWEINI